MSRFTEIVFDLEHKEIFELLKSSKNIDFICTLLDLINIKEINLLHESDISELIKKSERAMKLANIENIDENSENWARYRLSQEIDALILFLYSKNKEFISNHLVIKGEEHLKEIKSSDTPRLFISPHWGAFYSVPLILSSLGIEHIPISNAGEEDNLNRYLDELLPEHKAHILSVHSTSNPTRLLQEMCRQLRKKVSLLIYPEYTLGNRPKYCTNYFGQQFPASQGVAHISLLENVIIQPIAFRRVKESITYELSFFPPLDPSLYKNDVSLLNKSLHKVVEQMVMEDVSQWWYWEVFCENLIERGKNEKE